MTPNRLEIQSTIKRCPLCDRSKKNFMADTRELRETLGAAANGTALRVIGSSRKYKEVTETGEILTAIVNLAAANRELWPYDQVGKTETRD